MMPIEVLKVFYIVLNLVKQNNKTLKFFEVLQESKEVLHIKMITKKSKLEEPPIKVPTTMMIHQSCPFDDSVTNFSIVKQILLE